MKEHNIQFLERLQTCHIISYSQK